MKLNLNKLVKTVFFISSIFVASTGFSQTMYNNYQDGKIWFKLKQDQIVHLSASRGNQDKVDLNNLKLATMPYLRDVFTAHSVTRLAQPFPKAYGSDALLKTYLIEFSDINNVESFIRELEESGVVDYAEKVPLDKITLTPNDPLYNSTQMWGLFQINAEQAWNVSTGSSSIVVATTDNAIEIAHPDLANVIWTNTGEIAGNGTDDDGNGYVDDVNGYDVGDNDNDPSPPNSNFDHGTHVAGTTGAESNNGTGVASIGFGVSVMAVKSTRNNAGSNSITNGYDGIYYATVSGAHIINCSWGGTGFSTTGQNVVNYAWNNGSIVVAAAGNDGTDNDATPHYPSSYSNAIAVASSTTGDVKSSFSNYGATSVDITAPGSSIRSTVPFGNYAYMSGTSMASPMVSGLLGLMKSLNPSMPNTDLINCMYSTADNIDGVNPSYAGELGAGRINAFAAMNCVSATLNNPPVANFTANFTTINAGGTVTFTDQSTYNPTTWSWNFDNQGLGGVTPATASTQGPHNVTYSTPGVYEVSLTVTNAFGNDTETKTAYITVNTAGACEIINMDTTSSPFHFGWSPVLYNATNGGNPYGYVAGVNGYDDVAKTDYFNAAQTSGFNYMIGTYVWFGNAYSANPAKTIDVNVYDGTGGTVGAILATKTLDMAYVMANTPGIPYIAFDNAVNMPASGEVFVGVDFSNLSYSAGDTLGIVTNTNGESSPNTAWEQWSDLTWHDYASAWGINVSHYIMPWLTNDTTAVSLSATPLTICEGDMVSYDATGSTYQDTLLWTFNGASPVNSNNITENMLYNTAGTYTTYLEVVGGGCSRYAVDSVTITVNPTPSITITSPTDTICSGNSVTLTAAGGSSYLWSPGGQTTAAINVSPGTTTTYNVDGTTAGCTGNASKTIYVEAAPTALATYTPGGTICAGDNVSFDGTSSTGAATYSWSFPQGSPSMGSSTSPLPIVSFGAAGTHNYSLQVTNSCGTDTYNGTVTITSPNVVANATSTTICAGDPVTLTGSGATSYSWDNGVTNGTPFNPTATTTYTVTGTTSGCSAQDQITVTVNALPTVVANASATTICTGDPVTLTGSGASSYSWDNGVTDGVAFTPGSTTTYTVTGTDANTCQNTDQITVTVNPPPTTVANATSTSVCAGDPVTLTGSGATSYSWDNGVTDGVAFTPASTTTYTVTGSTGSCSSQDQITVTVNALPNVVANASATSICAGDPVTLTGSGATSYSWDNGATDGVPTTPGATTTYTVTGTDANTCQNTDQVTVTVNVVDVTVNTVGATITANATPATYQWLDCNASFAYLTGETNQNYTATVNGDYAVEVTQNGCIDTSACENIIISGLAAIADNNTVGIYPNPTNNVVNISLKDVNTVNAVTLSDVQGKLIYSTHTVTNKLTIDLSKVTKGIYFLQVIEDNDVNTYKVIKQ